MSTSRKTPKQTRGEWGIFNDESANHTADQALEAQLYSREAAEARLTDYDPDDSAFVHEVEQDEEEAS